MDYNPVSNPSVEDTFHLRGQLSGWDWQVGDLTTDNNPHELDCSGIVPVGTKAVYISGFIQDNLANTYILLYENGYTPLYNQHRTYVPAVSQNIGFGYWVGLDANRKCQYRCTSTAIASLNMNIAAWIK